jgi:hypothetical protein
VRLRRLLLQAVGEFTAGRIPALAQHDQIDYARIRAGAGVIPAKSDWRTVIP